MKMIDTDKNFIERPDTSSLRCLNKSMAPGGATGGQLKEDTSATIETHQEERRSLLITLVGALYHMMYVVSTYTQNRVEISVDCQLSNPLRGYIDRSGMLTYFILDKSFI